ncbi:membrane protein [Knoellia subterranea KCTC 19937]|uniref:Membrane protein n=1 Tax=Knoellia subterranea KCTC 19937 TaxID=1385521 RepID=A0A0A0JUH4_9MICO|nr:membrane protein [Knoellia subterranea KCTC 19937]
MAYLITGPAVFGAIGFGLDKLLGTGFIVVLGILAGMALSLYTIWLRYGTS